MSTTFAKMKLKYNEPATREAVINGELTLEVRRYLPQKEKASFVEFVILNSLDENTGCFSSIRLDTYFGIALVKWYGGVAFTDKQLEDAAKVYDILQTNGIIDGVVGVIPQDEYNTLESYVSETAEDMARYNNSFAGMMANMSGEANDLGQQVDKILSSIKNREGLELLGVIKDIHGQN